MAVDRAGLFRLATSERLEWAVKALPGGAALLVVWGLVTAGIVARWLLPVIVVGSVGASIWRLERRS